MPESRDVRRCALQAMYQLDANRDSDAEPSREALLGSLAESPGDTETHKSGLALAIRAWARHAQADAAVAALAPEWPTYRQPVVDRNILRLAYFEIESGQTPPKVAINEAVELAREFSTQKSPAFVNGVLDKIMRNLTRPPDLQDRRSNDAAETGVSNP